MFFSNDSPESLFLGYFVTGNFEVVDESSYCFVSYCIRKDVPLERSPY